MIIRGESCGPVRKYDLICSSGYTTEVSLWIELALTGADIGTLGNSNSTGSGVVYIDPSIWSSSSPVPQCYPPCTLIMPPQPLSTTTTITFPPWTTEVYYSTVTTRTTVLNNGNTTAILGYTVFTVATVITIPPGELEMMYDTFLC